MTQKPLLNLFPTLEEKDIEAIEAAIVLMEEIPLNNMSQWKNKEELNESISVDTSGLTSALILSAHIDSFLQNAAFSLADILQEKHQAALCKPKEILQLLSSEGIVSGQKIFKDSLIKAAETMDIIEPEEVLEDPYALAFLRLNALTTFKGMRRDQFVAGSTKLRTTFQLNSWVYEFININSMIAAATRQTMDGVTLTLIRDPEVPENTYFGFLVRYGENIIFLSDKPEFDNPAQSSWSRNPGKGLEKRINKSLFPYSVLNIKYDARDRAYVPAPNSLVLHQETAYRVQKISNLCKDEALWALLLTDLIHAFICKTEWQKEELTYTAEMVVNPQVLQNKGIIVPTGYIKLELPEITRNDVTYSAVKKSDMTNSGCRNWLEDLYGPNVSESILKIDTGNTPMLVGAEKGSEIKSHLALRSQTLTNFGTKAEIQKSRIWIARWNYTRQIIVDAKKDYADKVESIKEWYLKKLTERLAVLVNAVVKGEYIAPHEQRNSWDRTQPPAIKKNILRKLDTNYSTGKSTHIVGEYSRQFDEYYGIGNEIANQRYCFDVNNPEAIAQVCGCSIEELPIFLQHYHSSEPYVGNWMLSNVDPMDAFFHMNPWEDFPAQVVVHISAALLKKYQETPFTLTINKPDASFLKQLEQVKKEFGTVKDKKTGRTYKIKSYLKSSDSIQLQTKWRKNMQLNVADIFHNFELQF